MEKLTKVISLLFDRNAPTISLAAQLLTAQAEEELLNVSGLSALYFGIRLDNKCRITHPSCSLFASRATLDAVRSLCEWFGQRYFPIQLSLPDTASLDNDMARTLEKHRQDGGDATFSFGWHDGGYTLVTHKNAPSNSLPLLWYPMMGNQLALFGASFQPPFPRNPSRKLQLTAQDKERMERVAANVVAIRAALTHAK